MLVKQKHMRALAKKYRRRMSPKFVAAMNRHVEHKIIMACRVYIRGNITLDERVAAAARIGAAD